MTAAATEGTIRRVVRESLTACSEVGTPATWDCSDSRKEGMARFVGSEDWFSKQKDLMKAEMKWLRFRHVFVEAEPSDALNSMIGSGKPWVEYGRSAREVPPRGDGIRRRR